MDGIIVHDNTANPVTDTVGGFVSVGFSFTASNLPGYGLSEVDLGLYNPAGTNFGHVQVSLRTGYSDAGSNTLADLGSKYDAALPSSSGGLTAFSLASPLLLQAGAQYVIVVSFSSYSSSLLEFSASTQGVDVVGETYNDSTIARSYGQGPTSPTGSYVARVVEASSTSTTPVSATAVCYAAGTLILTARGEVAIEKLRAGDLLFSPRTLSFVPATWLAHQRVRDPAHRAVRVLAGALGPGKPHTDLVTSPNHSLFLDGILAPAYALVNGATIRWEPRPAIDYHHIECAAHDLVLANGAPAETWLDYGNRQAFDNADTHPAFTPLRHKLAEANPVDLPGHCVPCRQDGPQVMAIRRSLQAQAMALGCTVTGDADLHVLADGVRVEPHWVASIAAFHLPHQARDVQLMSRSARPQDTHDTLDTRVLGIAVRCIWVADRLCSLETLEGRPGWWALETSDAPFRWTDGAAALPNDALSFRIEVQQQLDYLVPPATQATTASAVA